MLSQTANKPYSYRAIATRVIDGDTVCCNIELMSRFGLELPPIDIECDLGFSVWMKPCAAEVWVRKVSIRLYGINAPELHGSTGVAGTETKRFLESLIETKEIYLETQKTKSGTEAREKFGRYLGILYLDGVNINQLLVNRQLAVAKTY